MKISEHVILESERFTAALPGNVYEMPALKLERGDCLAVFGLSEANPSLLLQILAGQISKEGYPLPPSPGEIKQRRAFIDLSGWPITFLGKHLYEDLSAFRHIGVVYSDPDQGIIGRTVLEDYWNALVAAGGEPDRQEAAIKLRPYALEDKLDRKSRVLSGGEKQRLNCATALAGARSMVVADLTAANLDQDFLLMFVRWMNEFCKTGGVLVISGIRTDQLALISDARKRPCVVSCHGQRRTISFENPDEVLFPQLNAEAANLKHAYKARRYGEELLRILNVRWPHITLPVSFSVKAGEVVRLSGFNGSGKTTLGNIIVGRLSPREIEGEIHLADEVRPAMSLQFPDRALLGLTLKEELSDQGLIELCGLNGVSGDIDPRKLPYSKRKLVTVASALQASIGIAILDEPTCGMDHPDKVAFVELINRFSDLGVIVITHDPSLVNIGREIRMGEVSDL